MRVNTAEPYTDHSEAMWPAYSTVEPDTLEDLQSIQPYLAIDHNRGPVEQATHYSFVYQWLATY